MTVIAETAPHAAAASPDPAQHLSRHFTRMRNRIEQAMRSVPADACAQL